MNIGDTVTIEDVTALKETDAALLCEIDGNQLWIPQSQISEDSEVYQEGHVGKLIVSGWIAKKKGLI